MLVPGDTYVTVPFFKLPDRCVNARGRGNHGGLSRLAGRVLDQIGDGAKVNVP